MASVSSSIAESQWSAEGAGSEEHEAVAAVAEGVEHEAVADVLTMASVRRGAGLLLSAAAELASKRATVETARGV